MIVQNDDDLIRLSDEFRWELLTREEALQLLEDLTEAIRMCPVDLKPNASVSIPGGEPGYAPRTCSALIKECERVVKYLREIGEQSRDESTFPSSDYADAMADSLEYVLKQNASLTLAGKEHRKHEND